MGRKALFVFASLLGVVAAGAAEPPAGVREIRGVAYHDGPDADPVRHRLDLYLPAGRDFPVVFFVHGGGWRHGDKDHFGLGRRLGHSLARHGIGLVSTNYRLTPAVRHPGHIEDVARAFAWTVRNIDRYGGRPDEVFVCGHSAGGHLAALLATDERYLRAHGLSLANVRGAVPVSGVYRVTPHLTFTTIFGTDPAGLRDASPLHHAGPAAPPFLVLHAESEFPGCGGDVARDFGRALRENGSRVTVAEVAGRNHVSILWRMVEDDDPVNQALQGFVLSQVALDRLAREGTAGVDVLGAYLAP